MKVMRVMVMLLTIYAAKAQEIQVRKVDSTHWQILNIQRYENGAYSLNASQLLDSATAVGQIFGIANKRREIVEAQVDKKAFEQMDTLLQKMTGVSYEITYRNKLLEALQGEWVAEGKDLRINITIKDKTVIGGLSEDGEPNDKGVLDIIDKNTFTITGVFDLMATFRITDKGPVAKVGKELIVLSRKPEKGK